MARTDPRPNYGTKRRIRKEGYIDIWEPSHPLARRDGYVFEHRKMAWDAGLFTNPAQQVHHKNERKDDNRLDNFVIMSTADHARHHARPGMIVRNQYGEGVSGQGVSRLAAERKAAMPPRSCTECGKDISTLRTDASMCGQQCRMRKFQRARLSQRQPTAPVS